MSIPTTGRREFLFVHAEHAEWIDMLHPLHECLTSLKL